MIPFRNLLAVALLALAPCAGADDGIADVDPDVTYFAVVKNHVFAQDMEGRVSETGYSFLAYVFLKPDAVIRDAFLTFPGGARKEPFPDFRDLGTVEEDTYLFVRSDRIYPDKRSYDADFPNGEYIVEFTTSAGARRATLVIDGDNYPAPAVMHLEQSGLEVAPDAVDANRDLVVTWGGFPQGRADPRGILDDVVFVIVKDCHGGKVLHSGRPYQGFHLLYRDTQYVVPAGTMQAGRRYELIVDNGITVDSTAAAGVPGVGFYAQTNKMPLVTVADGSVPADCAANPEGSR